MANPKLSDIATEAHWGFTEDAKLMSLLKGQSAELAGVYGVDKDDLFQEVCLWLAVRPKLQKLSTGMILGRTRAVGQTQYRNAKRRPTENIDDFDL